MLRYYTLLLFLLCCLSLPAQVSMQVTEVIISKLESYDWERILFTDTPFLEAQLLLENNSDTTIIFDPFATSVVTLNYTLDSIKITKNLDS